MQNPFLPISQELQEVKNLLLELINKPSEEEDKLYSVKEASVLLKVDQQTVRSKIKKGILPAIKFGNRYRIHHKDIFDSLGEVKSLKYKR